MLSVAFYLIFSRFTSAVNFAFFPSKLEKIRAVRLEHIKLAFSAFLELPIFSLQFFLNHIFSDHFKICLYFI